MKKIIYTFGIVILAFTACFGIYCAQTHTWNVTKNHFYILGKNPGYIPTGNGLRPIILGFDQFVADLFWIRTVQYAGGHSGAFEFDSLPDYIDLITDLDPHFGFAYHFGALVYPMNKKTIGRVEPLLKKGIQMNRESYPELLPEMYTDLAFYTYYYKDDLEKGAEIYEECSVSISGCPKYAKNVTAFLRSKIGKHEIALRIWLSKLFEDWEKSNEEMELIGKKIEESSKLVALTCAANNYQKKNSKPIANISELLHETTAPCKGFDTLDLNHRKALDMIAKKYDLQVISKRTLTTPFLHNPFRWDKEGNKVSAKYW